MEDMRNRRRFLQFLAASPVLGGLPASAWQAAALANPKEALSVMDFEPIARQKVPIAHFAYMQTGVDDDATSRPIAPASPRYSCARAAWWILHARRCMSTCSAHIWDAPIFFSPTGSQRAFHAEGEMGTAGAAKSRKTLMILSTQTTTPIEKVMEAAGSPVWYQLYATSKWSVTETLVKHAEAAGAPVLVLTTDYPSNRNTETLDRARRLDTRTCANCHGTGAQRSMGRHSMFQGIDMQGVSLSAPSLTWDSVQKLKKLTKMKLVLKGIETGEDAKLCVENGVDGIIVSNHGGRELESRRGTIECLPEVMAAVGTKIPVMVDGGFRRGTDVFKALAMGARAVGIGRPYLWGLGAFGQPGVERVLDILHTELLNTMKQCGTRSVAEINPNYIKWKL